MTKAFQSLEGGCRCGGVRVKVTAPPLLTMACHCKGCQRMTASAFSLSALIPGPAFSVTTGAPVIGGMRASPEHFFCPQCMSWVFTRLPEAMGDFVNLRATMLDDVDPVPPFIETCTVEKLPWANTMAAHSYSQFPPPEDFPTLIAEYSARAG
jgi:hypothetical protein